LQPRGMGSLRTQVPNKRFNRSAERRRRSVPVALRAPAPG
jgi:hypothetical protein